MVSLIFSVIQGDAQDWFSNPALAGYAVAAVALGLFI